MNKAPPRYYWDSCLFISLISGDPERVPTLRELMLKAQGRKVEILTSTFTIAEVAFATYERIAQKPDARAEEAIRKLWAPPSPITLVDFHQFVAEECRALMRAGLERGWTGLKGKDAVHLATAKLVGVDEVHTYDPKLPKYGDLIGIKVCEPWLDQGVLISESSTPAPAQPT